MYSIQMVVVMSIKIVDDIRVFFVFVVSDE